MEQDKSSSSEGMSVSVFDTLTQQFPLGDTAPAPTRFWWNTTGRNVADMLRIARYPEASQRAFLTFYRDKIAPLLLGGAVPPPPTTTMTAQADGPAKSGLTGDGTPLEYSFSFSGTLVRPTVRLSADLSPLRCRLCPQKQEQQPGLFAEGGRLFALMETDAVVRALADCNGDDVDLAVYDALKSCFALPNITDEDEAREIIAKAGHASPAMVGFDIQRAPDTATAARVPAMGKVYFLPCHAAAAQGRSRWAVVRETVHGLLQRSSPQHSAKLSVAFDLVDAFVAAQPPAYEEVAARYLATDLVAASRGARLKMYLRAPSWAWEDIWNLLTLGGRLLPADDGDGGGGDGGIQEVGETLKSLMERVLGDPVAGYNDAEDSGSDSGAAKSVRSSSKQKSSGRRGSPPPTSAGPDRGDMFRKMPIAYFALSADSPVPSPKMFLYCPGCGVPDGEIARRLDAWFADQGWADKGEKTDRVFMVDAMREIFPDRDLDRSQGIFTFLAVSQKKSATGGRELTMEVYLNPMLYTESSRPLLNSDSPITPSPAKGGVGRGLHRILSLLSRLCS